MGVAVNISYDEIRRIHRLEKTSSKLVDVEEDFFDSVNAFMIEEKKSYLEGLKNLSASKARDFSNLKKMVEEIFLIREKKLLNKALVCSRTGELSEGKLALQEQKTLEGLLEVLEQHKAFLSGVFEENKPKNKDSELVSVKILRNLPSFVGSDMKEYGPFSEGSTEKVPFKIANLLISRQLAAKE